MLVNNRPENVQKNVSQEKFVSKKKVVPEEFFLQKVEPKKVVRGKVLPVKVVPSKVVPEEVVDAPN